MTFILDDQIKPVYITVQFTDTWEVAGVDKRVLGGTEGVSGILRRRTGGEAGGPFSGTSDKGSSSIVPPAAPGACPPPPLLNCSMKRVTGGRYYTFNKTKVSVRSRCTDIKKRQ